ncbi:MAG: TIR domain-containing protein [Sandaracinaceae bacterium]|nr:MAG: TIR domain-containing protein [Sandaracinaceae bacterium]
MAFATARQLRASGGTLTEGHRKLAKSLGRQDLFLSHTQRDSEYVGPAIGLLEKHGAHVYVDLLDPAIKTLSGAAVADRVRGAVKQCRRLVALITHETKNSKWIPWEMGLADTLAGAANIALLPIRTDMKSSGLLKQEYFQLYPTIEWTLLQGEERHRWVVRNPSNGRYWRLEKWLERTAPAKPKLVVRR